MAPKGILTCVHPIVLATPVYSQEGFCIVQSKSIKIQEIPPIGRNACDFFCVLLYPDYLSDLHKMFQAISTYDTDVEYRIWNFCCHLFLSFADNTHRETNR